jgi:3-carboxy-cis,cis-muconate cycloisomerase
MTAFAGLFVPDALRAAVSDRAWFAAMLDAERALASASAAAGAIPPAAAAAIAAGCDAELYDTEWLAAEGRAVANPAEPLVRALRARVGEEHGRYVHRGATSQDVLDTAGMLVARDALALSLAELDSAAAACARLASEHRKTPTAARTLLQQAVPTTFGYKAAVWLASLLDARTAFGRLTLPAQLGGAAGTLAAFGDRGPDVLARFAAELGLAEPLIPWHTRRTPVVELAFALTLAAGAAAKIALDIVLLAQTEVGEVREAAGGASSTMPHKRNPAQAVRARACARGALAQTALLANGEHEHERAAGAWQAEWTALTEALALTGGALAAVRASLATLEVDAERMRANMSGDLLSEARAVGADGDYLGAAPAFVDRVLAAGREATRGEGVDT